MHPRMVLHPIKPELDGKDVSDMKDPNGKPLFVEFVDTVKKDGAGYVDYLWPRPGASEPEPKRSYVKPASRPGAGSWAPASTSTTCRASRARKRRSRSPRSRCWPCCRSSASSCWLRRLQGA